MWSRLQYYDLTTVGGTGSCVPMRIIFGSVIESCYSSPNIKFGVNGRLMCSRLQYTDLTYMGGAGPCAAMRIIFDIVI